MKVAAFVDLASRGSVLTINQFKKLLFCASFGHRQSYKERFIK